ncbi:MAG: hypothetical protein RLZZ144_124 [Pseudomonadota bacterium]|jgi:hypothetical protein
MNQRIQRIVEQIAELRSELSTLIDERESRLRYRLEGKRVVFEQTLLETHQRVKIGVFRWFRTVRPQNYLTMPLIYGAMVPLLFFDICISLYQAISFPIYRIAKVKRADYIIFDHQHLAYLNIIEKSHCLYCSYAVGMVAYAQEIIARTEQYFCPIKHARHVTNAHSRYESFLNYGEGEHFQDKLETFRDDLGKEKNDAHSD